jgi:hypothetical protein
MPLGFMLGMFLQVAWQSEIGETYKVLVKSILNRITDRNHPADPGPLLSENGGSFKLVVCNSPVRTECTNKP